MILLPDARVVDPATGNAVQNLGGSDRIAGFWGSAVGIARDYLNETGPSGLDLRHIDDPLTTVWSWTSGQPMDPTQRHEAPQGVWPVWSPLVVTVDEGSATTEEVDAVDLLPEDRTPNLFTVGTITKRIGWYLGRGIHDVLTIQDLESGGKRTIRVGDPIIDAVSIGATFWIATRQGIWRYQWGSPEADEIVRFSSLRPVFLWPVPNAGIVTVSLWYPPGDPGSTIVTVDAQSGRAIHEGRFDTRVGRTAVQADVAAGAAWQSGAVSLASLHAVTGMPRSFG